MLIVAGVVWGIFCLIGAILLIIVIVRDKKSSGTNVTVNIGAGGGNIKVDGTAKIVAVSRDFFVIRKHSGESVTSQPGETPPPWEEPAYYTINADLASGEWLVSGKQVKVHATGDKWTTVTDVFDESQFIWAFGVSLMIGGGVWAAGMLIAQMIIKP